MDKFNCDKDILNYIKSKTSDSKDMVYKELYVDDNVIYLVYSQALCKGDTISDFIVRSIKDTQKINNLENIENTLEDLRKSDLKSKINKKLSINNIYERLFDIENHLSASSLKKIDLKKDDIFYYIFSGFTLVIYDLNIIAIETKAELNRSITEPTNEKTLRGSKDSFIENYVINIGLIRKRVKDEKLVLEEKVIGRRSKTKVGLMYISDIARKELVSYVENRLKNIDIDAIIDSNYIVEIMEESKNSDFPTAITTERPDNVACLLLEGRIAIVVENSPFVIIVPAFLQDFVNSIEDRFQKYINIGITKVVRFIAFFITIFTPGMYIALTTFNQESIPTDLLIAFSTQRQGVPFPAYLEAFLMITAFELLREGDFRVPNASGSTLSIVGALILGDAAVNAGIVSPIMIIVIAITTISGLMFNDINMSNALRTWRILILIFGSVAGVLGIGIGAIFLITKLCSTTSFTKPYLYPISPLNLKYFFYELFKRKSIKDDYNRKEILTDNLTKYKIR